MDLLTQPEAWIAFLTLTALELILGVDNIVMITVLADRLPEHRRRLARRTGLVLAMVARIALLFSLTWLMRLETVLFEVLGHGVSGRDLILLAGGLFLIAKATHEIHVELEGEDAEKKAARMARATLGMVLLQIVMLDVVFSLDSVVTAIGMADRIEVMVAAIVVAVAAMIFLMAPVARFIGKHPAVKMLALSFLLLIGVTLVAEGLGQSFPKGYIYFAFGFSIFVEVLQMRRSAVAAKATGKSTGKA
jgi:predicted tellurium resistance membrane protein TerC